jgi:hypothetical protein
MGWRAMVCAGACVLLAGCWADGTVLRPGGEPAWGHLEVPAAPGSAALTAQMTLSNLGVRSQSGQAGEAKRLEGRTPSGQNFTLLLVGERSGAVEKTHVRIAWEKEADEEFWRQLKAALEAEYGRAGGAQQ